MLSLTISISHLLLLSPHLHISLITAVSSSPYHTYYCYLIISILHLLLLPHHLHISLITAVSQSPYLTYNCYLIVSISHLLVLPHHLHISLIQLSPHLYISLIQLSPHLYISLITAVSSSPYLTYYCCLLISISHLLLLSPLLHISLIYCCLTISVYSCLLSHHKKGCEYEKGYVYCKYFFNFSCQI